MSWKRPKTTSRRPILGALPLTLGCLWLLAGCGEMFDAEQDPSTAPVLVQQQALTPMCTVKVQGKGAVNVEDYLARVVRCENGAAPQAALEAQAIAARTYAKFKMETSGSLIDGQGDQVYSCGKEPEQRHRDAVAATRGLVLTHGNVVLASFYVSGAPTQSATCRPTEAEIGRASAIDRKMERSNVTYNEGKSGNAVIPTRLGHPGNPRNRGCMSQNGGSCLSKRGYDAQRILKFYYGEDVKLTQLGGACGGAAAPSMPSAPATPTDGSGTQANQGQTPTVTATPPATCVALEGDPRIEPRVVWNARPAKGVRAAHSPTKITIQHTVTRPNINGPSAMREVQAWHMDQHGWADIGYHYVVARDGTIYEGTPVAHQGAHLAGKNAGNLGVALVGNFQTETPSHAQFNATAHLVRYLSKRFDIGLNRQQVQGANEQVSTQSPGIHMISQLDRLVSVATSASKTCDTPAPGGAGEGTGGLEPPQLPTTDGGSGQGYNTLPQGSATGSNDPVEDPNTGEEFQYVRITNVGPVPARIDGVVLTIPAEPDPERGKPAVYAEASPGVIGKDQAVNRLDVNDCATLVAKAALIPPGGTLTLDMFNTFTKGQTVKVRRSLSSVTNCPEDQSEGALIKIEIAAQEDGPWQTLSQSSKTDTDFEAGGGMIAMDGVPVPGEKASKGGGFGGFLGKLIGVLTKVLQIVGLVSEVANLEIFSGIKSIGKIADVAGKVGNYAEKGIEFLEQGKQLITVIGRDAAGNPVQAFSKIVDFSKELALKTLKEGAVVNALTKLQSVANAATKVVKYFVGDQEIGESSNPEDEFALVAMLPPGQQNVRAVSYDENGMIVAEESVNVTVNDTVGSGMRFELPQSGGSYQQSVTMAVQVSNPAVKVVRYVANPNFPLGESSNAADLFIYTYTFNTPGQRTITALGYDEAGSLIDQVMIPLTITSPQGVVPAPEDPAAPADPSAQPADEIQIDQAKADLLARKASRVDGRRSQGRCWGEAYVSMTQAGYSYSAFRPLETAGPCSSGNFLGSAYCVGRNFSANPQLLGQHMKMQKIDAHPKDAPIGSLIVWDKGCNGYHAVHGHIEIKIAQGRACSDFCGTIRSGGDSCVSVFVPILPGSAGR